MNKRDLYIMEQLKKDLDKKIMRQMEKKLDDESNLIFVSTNLIQLARTNLILLNLLLHQMNLKGIFISVDRPHQYMVHLLNLQHIPQQNLIYIDLISNVSGQVFDGDENDINSKIIDGPFEISKFPNMVFKGYDMKGMISLDLIDIKKQDFVLIDNIATLTNYNSIKEIEGFVKEIIDIIKSADKIVCGVTIDTEKYNHIFELIKIFSNNIIEVKDEWFHE